MCIRLTILGDAVTLRHITCSSCMLHAYIWLQYGYLWLTRYLPIHQEAPAFVDMSVEAEILVTGIKVVDLLAPYAKGGKIGELVLVCPAPTHI